MMDLWQGENFAVGMLNVQTIVGKESYICGLFETYCLDVPCLQEACIAQSGQQRFTEAMRENLGGDWNVFFSAPTTFRRSDQCLVVTLARGHAVKPIQQVNWQNRALAVDIPRARRTPVRVYNMYGFAEARKHGETIEMASAVLQNCIESGLDYVIMGDFNMEVTDVWNQQLINHTITECDEGFANVIPTRPSGKKVIDFAVSRYNIHPCKRVQATGCADHDAILYEFEWKLLDHWRSGPKFRKLAQVEVDDIWKALSRAAEICMSEEESVSTLWRDQAWEPGAQSQPRKSGRSPTSQRLRQVRRAFHRVIMAEPLHDERGEDASASDAWFETPEWF